MTRDERRIARLRAEITAERTGEGYPWPPETERERWQRMLREIFTAPGMWWGSVGSVGIAEFIKQEMPDA